jgi:hypothetical protein
VNFTHPQRAIFRSCTIHMPIDVDVHGTSNHLQL